MLVGAKNKKELFMKIIYETKRLIIREWEERDCYDLYEYASDERVAKYLFPPYKDLDSAKKRIEKLIAQYKEGNNKYDYPIVLKSENKVIGSISMSDYKPQAGGIIMIGYTLNHKYQGNGYATEAVIGMFKHIKRNNIAKRIFALHDVENEKSGNVMKRAGMTFEGILRKAGENQVHSRYDVAMYSILDEEICID